MPTNETKVDIQAIRELSDRLTSTNNKITDLRIEAEQLKQALLNKIRKDSAFAAQVLTINYAKLHKAMR